MIESIKFRGFVKLLRTHPLILSDSVQVQQELSSIEGQIIDMKDRVIVESIPCELVIIDTGFILFGKFGSISGNFNKNFHYIWGEVLIISNNKSIYRLIVEDKDKEKLKKVLSELELSK